MKLPKSPPGNAAPDDFLTDEELIKGYGSMAVKILVATLNTDQTDESDVALDIADDSGATVGTLTLDRDTWEELGDDVDTIVVDGVADIEVE